MTEPPPVPFNAAVRQCYGKRRFSTRKDARQATTRMVRTSGKPAWSYYCDICSAYHLTSQDPKAWRRGLQK